MSSRFAPGWRSGVSDRPLSGKPINLALGEGFGVRLTLTTAGFTGVARAIALLLGFGRGASVGSDFFGVVPGLAQRRLV